MAENESLDLARSPRLRVVFDAVEMGDSCDKVSEKFKIALIGWLRNALKRLKEKGVTLADLLKNRDCPQDLRHLLRQTEGHECVRLFISSASVSGPTEIDCVAGWVDAVLDKMTDQICHGAAGSNRFPTIDDVQDFTREVRDNLTPAVDRIVAKFNDDPNWLPKQAARRGRTPVNGTAELMDLSLIGRPLP